MGRVEARGDRARDPRVGGDPVLVGRALEAALERAGQAQADAGELLVALRRLRVRGRHARRRRGIGLGDRHGELRLAGAQPHVDGPGRELAGDLCRRVAQGIEQGHAQRRLEGEQEAFGQGGRLVAAHLGHASEFIVHASDVWVEVHDLTMTSQ